MATLEVVLIFELIIVVVVIIVVVFIVPLDSNDALEQAHDLLSRELELIVRLHFGLECLGEAAVKRAFFLHVCHEVILAMVFAMHLELFHEVRDHLLDRWFSNGIKKVVELIDEFVTNRFWELHALTPLFASEW